MKKIIIDALIAMCQREGTLPAETDALLDRLVEITDFDRETLEEILFN